MFHYDRQFKWMKQSVVGRWCPSKFGRTGTQLYDLSGYNNTGTLTGMDPATDWVNNGLDFDGSGDYVSGSGNSFSVRAWSVWFNPRSTINSSSSFQTILQTRFGTNNSFLVSFGSATILLSNEYITITDTTGNHRIGVTDGGSISAGSWHNLFVNSNYTGYEIWLDGVKKSLTTTGTVGASPIFNALRIGCFDGDGGGPRGFFNGEIDDVTISNTPLEPSQILDLYHAGPGAGLVPYRKHIKRWVRGVSYKPVYRRRTKKVGNIYQDKAWQNLNNNIIGRWCPSVYGKTGTQLYDLSGYNNTGTLTNMDTATDWTDEGLDFDGSNDHVLFVDPPARFWTLPFSVSLWFFSRSGTTLQQMFGFGNSTNFSQLFVVQLRGNLAGDPIQAQMRGNDPTSNTFASYTGYTTNRWTHVVAVFARTNYRTIFVDGVEGTPDTTSYTVEPIDRMAIGALIRTPAQSFGVPFNGQLDDVILFNQPLTANEVQQLYHAGPGAGLSLSPKRSAMMYPPSPPAGGWKPYWLRPSSKIIGAGI